MKILREMVRETLFRIYDKHRRQYRENRLGSKQMHSHPIEK